MPYDSRFSFCPLQHVITALVPPQFYRGDCTPHVDCPRIMTFDAGSNAFVAVDTFDYVQASIKDVVVPSTTFLKCVLR